MAIITYNYCTFIYVSSSHYVDGGAAEHFCDIRITRVVQQGQGREDRRGVGSALPQTPISGPIFVASLQER